MRRVPGGGKMPGICSAQQAIKGTEDRAGWIRHGLASIRGKHPSCSPRVEGGLIWNQHKAAAVGWGEGRSASFGGDLGKQSVFCPDWPAGPAAVRQWHVFPPPGAWFNFMSIYHTDFQATYGSSGCSVPSLTFGFVRIYHFSGCEMVLHRGIICLFLIANSI